MRLRRDDVLAACWSTSAVFGGVGALMQIARGYWPRLTGGEASLMEAWPGLDALPSQLAVAVAAGLLVTTARSALQLAWQDLRVSTDASNAQVRAA